MHLIADAVIGLALCEAARRALRARFGYRQVRIPEKAPPAPASMREMARGEPRPGGTGGPVQVQGSRRRSERQAEPPQSVATRYVIATSPRGDAATAAMMDAMTGPGLLSPPG